MTAYAALLAEYVEWTDEAVRAFAALSEADLARRESPADWCVQEIVHHLADVEVGDALRLRQMISHEEPLIVPYDEQLFVQRLHYERPIASSLVIFSALRAANREILECLADSDWLRVGHHAEHDRYSVEILVQKSIEHDRAHLTQLRRALEGHAQP